MILFLPINKKVTPDYQSPDHQLITSMAFDHATSKFICSSVTSCNVILKCFFFFRLCLELKDGLYAILSEVNGNQERTAARFVRIDTETGRATIVCV